MVLSRRTFLKISGVFVTSAASFSFLSLLSGCSDNTQVVSGPVSGNSEEVIVTMSPGQEPSSGFDPIYSWGDGGHVHEPLIQSTLITTDVNFNFVNDLAKDYYCSKDGLHWTFLIRDDVYFTNGDQLTANDVAFTINAIINNDASETDLSMVKQAVANDTFTVDLYLSKPFNALLYTLAVVGIVPSKVYNSQTYGSNPIGSGRYMLEQWDIGEQVILKANPNYYGNQPLMKRVVVVFMEEDASLSAVNADAVDVAYTAATLVNQVNPKNYNVLICDSVDSRGISLPTIGVGGFKQDGTSIYQTGNDVTKSLAIRRAINYGLDRNQMVDNVLNGYGKPAYSVSDDMPWYSSDMQVTYDLDTAKSFLEIDGWIIGEDGIYVKDGVRASFELLYPADDSVRQSLANDFTNQMLQIGIEVIPSGLSWDQIYLHEYDTPVLWGWGSNSPIELYSLHYSNSAQNYSVYNNKTIDEHMDKALTYSDIADSYDEWKLAQWDGEQGYAPLGGTSWAWLVNIQHLYFKRDGLVIAEQKLHPHGQGWSLLNNVDLWYWE